MMTVCKSICLLFSVLAPCFLWAQKLNMDVMMGEKKIGDIQAEKLVKGKNLQFTMNSNVEANLMFTVTVASVTQTFWYNGALTLSKATRTSNIPGQNQITNVELKGAQYSVTKNEQQSTAVYPVRLCITNLYFQEPLKDTAAFSEIQGVYLPITNLGNHQYDVTHQNGKKDVYYYANGKLQKIETIIAGKNVVFVVT